MKLTKRERNTIFEVLEMEGLAPADCELGKQVEAVGPDKIERFALRHMPSGSSVMISNRTVGQLGWWVVSDVTDGPRLESVGAHWDNVLQHIAQWAEGVVYVAETPDLWAELQQVPEVLAAAQTAEASNTPFTATELTEISGRLDEIKSLVRERFDLTSEQLYAIDQRLDEVKEASGRLGRKDWLMVFYGSLVSVFVTDAVPPSVIQTILSVVVHGIAHLFGIGGPPPIITT
ncbi:MAG TPA: hypothetical protein VGH27_27440 [Streptosporangiaceae bacterium]